MIARTDINTHMQDTQTTLIYTDTENNNNNNENDDNDTFIRTQYKNKNKNNKEKGSQKHTIIFASHHFTHTQTLTHTYIHKHT